MSTMAAPTNRPSAAPSEQSFLGQVSAFAGRATRRSFRSSETIVQTVLFPLILLLTLLAAFSNAVEAFDGGDPYAQRLVPALVVSGVMFGSVGAAFGLLSDLQSGFMDRVHSSPISPAALVVGIVIAELARAFGAIVVLVAAGHLFGFRFQNGLIGAIGFVIVAVGVAAVIVWIGLAMATVAKSFETMTPPLSALFLILLFFSRGLVPLDAYPGWAQAIVRISPITAAVELLDGLSRGGPLAGPALRATLWSIVIVVVFGGFAIRRLVTASNRSGG